MSRNLDKVYFCGKISVRREESKMNFDRRPVEKVVREVSKIIKEKNYSIRSISEKAQSIGFEYMNRGVVGRNFYEGAEKQLFIKKLDDYIEAILTVTGFTNDDLFKRIIRPDILETGIQEELALFVRDPVSLPYIKMAYIQYKKDKLEEELRSLKSEMNNN